MNNKNTEYKFTTYSGLVINVFDPDPDSISIIDIAHSLSMQCRYGGHIKRFYSVAEHSVLCSYLINDENQLEALLHDATEAYLMDIPRPVKSGLPQYVEIENNLLAHISNKFGLKYPFDEHVWIVDDQILDIELNEVFLEKPEYPKLMYLDYKGAETLFLERFYKLYSERNEK